jgi:hypothetical protein
LEIEPQDVFVLISLVQLAWRHPGLTEDQKAAAVRVGRRLQGRFSSLPVSCPALVAMSEMGWLRDFDT